MKCDGGLRDRDHLSKPQTSMSPPSRHPRQPQVTGDSTGVLNQSQVERDKQTADPTKRSILTDKEYGLKCGVDFSKPERRDGRKWTSHEDPYNTSH